MTSYSVNIGLNCPGSSRQAARTIMKAAAAILRAGGAGVFIDNSALAHGRSDWLAMTDDGGTAHPDRVDHGGRIRTAEPDAQSLWLPEAGQHEGAR